MGRTRGPRFDLEPLLHAAGCYAHARKAADDKSNAESATSVFARMLGYESIPHMNQSFHFYRARREGLTWRTADTLACRLGLHPASVWVEEWWAAARDAERVA